MYEKFKNFLKDIKSADSSLIEGIEGIEEAFNVIFEATEDKVSELDQKLANSPLATPSALKKEVVPEVPVENSLPTAENPL